MKTRKKGFTIVEIMTVVAIIAILIGILIPALAKVRTMVKETQQRAQLNTIGLALTAFRNDYGDYPPSGYTSTDYAGGQKLAEALLGWDLMGFHPKTIWDSAGTAYLPATKGTQTEQEKNLNERKDIYLEDGSKYAFSIDQLFDSGNRFGLDPNTFVICDVFDDFRKVDNVRVGAPILYYKANINNKTIDNTYSFDKLIYTPIDNRALILAKEKQDNQNIKHPLADNSEDYKQFYKFIRDPKIPDPNPPRPYRPDTYLLISAGADGVYGTNDDITNFK